jgi:hypothetical protein
MVILLFFCIIVDWQYYFTQVRAKQTVMRFHLHEQNKAQMNIAFLFMTEVLDIQYYFNVILFHTHCRSLPRAWNK